MRWFDHMLRVPPYALICMGKSTMIESDQRDLKLHESKLSQKAYNI